MLGQKGSSCLLLDSTLVEVVSLDVLKMIYMGGYICGIFQRGLFGIGAGIYRI